jgi:hypothetical protein
MARSSSARRDRQLPRRPPPTAHRLAAWLSLARGLALAPAKAIWFPPNDDDVQTLVEFWRRRVAELRDAGVGPLRNRPVYARALACRPHAFAYAGRGEVCRLPFCPFCHAADAAAAYERVRRAAEERGKGVGFLLGQYTRRLTLEDLRAEVPPALAPADGALGSIRKDAVWPAEETSDKVVTAERVLSAVPPAAAEAVFQVRKKLSKARATHGHGVTFAEAGLDAHEVTIACAGHYAVRRAPLSLARAVGHLCQYPAALLTAPADAAAAVLDRMAGRRTSSVRGVFRTALPVHPRLFPLQFVPAQPGGTGVAARVASLLPHADEAFAARECARALGVPPAVSFAALSGAAGLPLYWLGRVEVSVGDLARPSRRSALYRAVAAGRPKRPGERHALVLLCPGVGLLALSTWPPVLPDQHDTTGIVNISCRGRRYGAEEVEVFGRRVRAARRAAA